MYNASFMLVNRFKIIQWPKHEAAYYSCSVTQWVGFRFNFVCLLTQPISKSHSGSKSHRRNAANQWLVCTDGRFLLLQHSQTARRFFLLQHSQTARRFFLLQHDQVAGRLVLLQQLLTPRDRIELLISFARSEAPSVASFWSCQAASLRFSDELETLNMKLHFVIGESHLTLSDVSMREQGEK